MEEHNKVNEHKDKIEEFRPKYEEEYERVWEPQFHQTVNFRTVWYDACNLFIGSQKAKQVVEEEYKQAAQHLYSSMLQGNSDAMLMFDFTFFCDKEKYNIYPIIYTYKVHAEILEIVRHHIEKTRKEKGRYFENDDYIRQVNKRILNLYDTEDMINSIFKLLCESCGDSFTYSNDVFTEICYFLNNLLEIRTQSIQYKLMVLFEKRAYSQKFFKQIHTYLVSSTLKLSTGNFINVYASDTGSVSDPCYFVNENIEKQMLRMIALLCSRLNYQMKEYMKDQIHSDGSFDLVLTTMDYLKALLPYMHYRIPYDTLFMCLQTVLEFVDGDQRSDINTHRVLEADIVRVATSILNLNYFEMTNSNKHVQIEGIYKVVKYNFDSIEPCSDRLSWMKNSDYVLEWIKAKCCNEVTSEDLRSQEFALLPHDATQQVKANFRIGLLKLKTLECLLELTNSGELVVQNAFLNIYSKLDPIIIRKNFAFQTEMFRYHHKEKYRTRLLNMAEIDPDDKTNSSFIIEIGYLMFSLLIKIDEFQMTGRKDHRYGQQIMKLLPEEVRNDVPFSQSTVMQISEFIIEIFKRLKRSCQSNTISFERAEQDAFDNTKVSKQLKFYADTTSQIDIYMENSLVNYTFIILPY